MIDKVRILIHYCRRLLFPQLMVAPMFVLILIRWVYSLFEGLDLIFVRRLETCLEISYIDLALFRTFVKLLICISWKLCLFSCSRARQGVIRLGLRTGIRRQSRIYFLFVVWIGNRWVQIKVVDLKRNSSCLRMWLDSVLRLSGRLILQCIVVVKRVWIIHVLKCFLRIFSILPLLLIHSCLRSINQSQDTTLYQNINHWHLFQHEKLLYHWGQLLLHSSVSKRLWFRNKCHLLQSLQVANYDDPKCQTFS